MNQTALVEGKYYRVMPQTKLHHIDGAEPIFMKVPLSEGLAIEEKQSNGLYIVIQCVDKTTHGVSISNVNTRFIKVLEFKDKDIEEYFERLQEYYNCLLFAQQALEDFAERENEGYFEESSEGDNRIFCYKGFNVELLVDDAGQQFYFNFDGKEYSCGAYNICPEEEIKFVIDNYLEENKK